MKLDLRKFSQEPLYGAVELRWRDPTAREIEDVEARQHLGAAMRLTCLELVTDDFDLDVISSKIVGDPLPPEDQRRLAKHFLVSCLNEDLHKLLVI
jgi:hypothetical protein